MDRCRDCPSSGLDRSTDTQSTSAGTALGQPVAIRFLRIGDVLALTGFRSKSTLYAKIQEGGFPRGQRLSHKMVVWPEPVIARWQDGVLGSVKEKVHSQQ